MTWCKTEREIVILYVLFVSDKTFNQFDKIIIGVKRRRRDNVEER